MRYLSQLLFGSIFGLGLAIAGMTSPQKVLAFLDVAGAWDPSLLFVLGGAVILAAISFRSILKRSEPLLDSKFHFTPSTEITKSLISGSVLFGIGWGICGYCPGPAVALLAVPSNPETIPVLVGLVVGIGLSLLVDKSRANPAKSSVVLEH